MTVHLPFLKWARTAVWLAALAIPIGLRAQSACMLVPVPLATRVQLATLVVEAQVTGQEAELLPGGSIVTHSALQVFTVLKGQPASPLYLLTPGGTVGLRRETVSGALTPAIGQQGIFLLEPDPEHPGALRLAAGPQGLLAYDLRTLIAYDPFGSYPAVGAGLYPTLTALTGQPASAVQPNAALAAAQAQAVQRATTTAQRPTATPVISSFSPAAVTAGTNNLSAASANGVLTINGSGFNATRGTGYVLFRSADNPGTTTQPLASAYLAWSDTQIQVRVPSASMSGNAAGTGPVQVVNSDGSAASSATNLTVTYALSNVTSSSQNYRIHLTGTGETGNPTGYVLRYASSLPTAAQAPFEAALASWRCQAGANRTVGAAAVQGDAVSNNDENVVRFGSLSAGVLGVTNSYFSGCVASGVLNWELTETDYTFSNTANWYYGTDTPDATQSDFQSVALHELGHGIQLTHIISSTGVMNYALTSGTTRRTLDSSTDLAAATDVTNYSTSATAAQRCGEAAYVAASGGCALPVTLTAFTARYVAGQGAALRWATASEQESAYFALESQDAPGTAWQEVTRLPAAGRSNTLRQYAALDARPLAGLRYYRLRQVDEDDRAEFSPIVAVQGEATALVAYPNPATGTVQLSGPAGAAAVCLLDATGRRVRRQVLAEGQAEVALAVAGLPAGLYVVEWQGATTLRTRLVVQ